MTWSSLWDSSEVALIIGTTLFYALVVSDAQARSDD